jgi:hypothetical protein
MLFGRLLRNFVRRHIVDDAPDEMAACFNCNVVECSNEIYETCPNRLAHTGDALGHQSDRGQLVGMPT